MRSVPVLRWKPGKSQRETYNRSVDVSYLLPDLMRAGTHGNLPCVTLAKIGMGRGSLCTRVRSRRQPWGLSALPSALERRVYLSNSYVQFAIKVMRKCCRMGINFSLLHPSSSYFWQIPELKRLRNQADLDDARLDSCCFGTPWRKKLTLLSNQCAIASFNQRCTQKVCEHSGKYHTQLGKRNAQGVFLSKLSNQIPAKLAQSLSMVMTATKDHTMGMGV